MIVIGHSSIECKNFIKIKNISDIEKTNPADIVWFDANDDKNYHLSRHCKENEIEYAIFLFYLKDAIFYNNLGAKYILNLNLKQCKKLQKLADMYFFDSKIIYIVSDFNEIEKIALSGIDGVILDSILNLSSKKS